jgi:hypothetical protein
VSIANVILLIGSLGGLSGAGALLTVLLQRRKLKADAADVLTDTALVLVEPLQKRVQELDAEAQQARAEARQARTEIGEMRAEMADVLSTMRRWKQAILSSDVSREQLQAMVREEHPVSF